MSATPKLTVGGWYGRVGIEILRGSESVAVVGRVQSNRLTHLDTVRSATAKRGEQAHEAEREAQGLEAFRGEALSLARKFAAVEELLDACRAVLEAYQSGLGAGAAMDARTLCARAVAKAEGR